MTPALGFNPVDNLKRRVYGVPLSFNPAEYDPSQTLPGTDEERIAALMAARGTEMLPYEYPGTSLNPAAPTPGEIGREQHERMLQSLLTGMYSSLPSGAAPEDLAQRTREHQRYSGYGAAPTMTGPEPLWPRIQRGLGQISDLTRSFVDPVDPETGMPNVDLAPVVGALTGKVDNLVGVFKPDIIPVRGATAAELKAMQKGTLTKEQIGRLKADIGPMSGYVTPQEAQLLLANKGNVESFNQLMTQLPRAAQIAATAKAGIPKREWYRASTRAILELFGLEDAPRFASLLAAMSPQTSVESNLYNTLQTWKNWTKAGRPTDPRAIRRIMGESVQGSGTEASVLEAWADNVERALTAKNARLITLSGPKVNSFFRNLMDDVYAVTNDAWNAAGMGIRQDYFAGSPTAKQLAAGNPGLSPSYIAASAVQRQAGDMLGMMPREVQESFWSTVMTMYERARKLGITPQEFLQRGLLTPEAVRGTVDFSTLLKEPRFSQPLEEAGYDVGKMTSFEWPTSYPSLTGSEQNLLGKTADILGRLMKLRGAESRAKTIVPVGDAPATMGWGFTGQEAIPYVHSGHLPGVTAEPSFGSRRAYSSRGFGLLEDPLGRDVIAQSLGLNPIENRGITGLYDPPGGAAQEIQPGKGIGTEVQIKWNKEGRPYIPEKIQDLINAANAVRGYIFGQGGTPFNLPVVRKDAPGMFVEMEKKVKPEAMLKAGKAKAEDVVIADTGGSGATVFSYTGRPLEARERLTLADILAGPESQYKQADVLGHMVSFEDEFNAAVAGQGKATTKLFTYLDKVEKQAPAKFRALDKTVREKAGLVYEFYKDKAMARKDTVREDLMRALEIMSKSGLPGLKTALKSGVALPAVAVALLGPSAED